MDQNHRIFFFFLQTLPSVVVIVFSFCFGTTKKKELFRSDSKKNSFCVQLSVSKQISWFNAQNLNDSIKCGVRCVHIYSNVRWPAHLLRLKSHKSKTQLVTFNQKLLHERRKRKRERKKKEFIKFYYSWSHVYMRSDMIWTNFNFEIVSFFLKKICIHLFGFTCHTEGRKKEVFFSFLDKAQAVSSDCILIKKFCTLLEVNASF